MNAFRWIACLLLAVFLSTLVPATVMAEERVDVAATVSSTSVEAVEGEEATVTVTISNIGPIPAPTVRFQFETQGVASVTISQGVCYEGRHPRAGQCDIGTMAVGQTVTLTYRHRGTGSQVVEFGAWSDDLNDINRRNNYLKVRIAYRNPFDPPVSVRESTSYTPTSRPMLGELQYYRTYTPRRVAITTGRDVELRWDYQSSAYAGNYPQGPGPEWIPRDIFLIGVQWQLQIWQNAVANSGYNATQEISALQRMIAQTNQYPPGIRLPEYLKYQPNCRTISEGCWTDEYRQQVADEQARAAKPPPPIWGNNARPAVPAPPVQPPPPPTPSTPAKPAAVPAPTPPAPPASSPSSPFNTEIQFPTVFSLEGSSLSVVNESQDGVQYDAKIHWQQYGDFMAAHPTMRGTVGQVIDFTTGLDVQGNLPISEVYINAALVALPVGKLAKPSVSLVKYGTGWVIKVGDYVIAKIIGGSAENITKKVIGERMLERVWGRIGVTLDPAFQKSAQGFDNVGRMGDNIVIGEAKYLGGATGDRVFGMDDLGKNTDNVIQMTEPWIRKVLARMKKTMETLVAAILSKSKVAQIKLHLVIVRESGKVGGVSDAVKQMFDLIIEVDTFGRELMRYTR